ncbi:MAG: signal transduction histidine kinase [Glaciecola sp.]|jgi:signal transduction histidine kinase
MTTIEKTHSRKNGFSLSGYIFILLSIFIVSLAIIQLWFIAHIEDKVSEEITRKSTALSNKAIEFIISKNGNLEVSSMLLPSIANSNKELALKVRELELIKEIRMDKEGDIVTEDISAEEVRSQVLKVKRKNIKIVSNENNVFEFAFPELGLTEIQVLSFQDKESAVADHFRQLSIATTVLMLLGLLFALWLSRHTSKPLKSLSEGFDKLKIGELGIQLPVHGVSEVKQTIEQFNQTSQRLDELQGVANRFEKQRQLAELGEVSRGLAHSLRNPLNTIGLAIEQIAQKNLTDTQRNEIAEQARMKITVLDRMIKSLLTLTTSGVNRDEEVNLNQAIDDAVLQIRMCCEQKIKIFAEQNVTLRGSIVEITALIHTLLSNAVEAISDDPQGSSQAIEIRLALTKQGAVVSVVDSGGGVTKGIAAKLFQPHITSKPEGAGMGLYIAKRIANLHYCGDINLVNNKTKGCTATLTLQMLDD